MTTPTPVESGSPAMREASVGLIVAAEAAAVIDEISSEAKAMRRRVQNMVSLLSCV
jgi:hypothetical protein